MPSSISSSSAGIRRLVPTGPWGLTWGVALAIAVALLIRTEIDVRERGFRPSVTDDQYLWAIERSKASTGERDVIVVLGDSRAQLGIATDELRRKLPDYRVVQLSLEFTTPTAALEDLARDDEFRGVVVVGVVEWDLGSEEKDTLERYVAAYHRRWRSPGAIAERWLATPLQAHLTFLSATGRRTLDALVDRQRWPRPIYIATQPDRSRRADYTLKDVAARLRRNEERVRGRRLWKKGAKAWLTHAMKLEPYVAAIRARGGEVVFLRMPMAGALQRASDKSFPRAKYWDRFSLATSARTIHFLDHPGLRDVPLPDDSHIDIRDAPRFTSALADILAEMGVVDRKGLVP